MIAHIMMLLPWYTKPQLPGSSLTWLLADGGIRICANGQGRASIVPIEPTPPLAVCSWMHKCKASEKRLFMNGESKHSRSPWTFQQFIKMLPGDVTLLCLMSVTALPVSAGERIKRLHSFILVSGSGREPFSPFSFFLLQINKWPLSSAFFLHILHSFVYSRCVPAIRWFLGYNTFHMWKRIKSTRKSLLLLWHSYICIQKLTLCQSFHTTFMLLTLDLRL